MNEQPVERKSVSVVVPAWNEVDSITNVLEGLTSNLENYADLEVVVVNDGSDDGTGRLVEEFAAKDRSIRVVKNHTRLGYGAALARGFEVAQNRFVAFIDGDGQIDPADVSRAVACFEPGVSAVIGRRRRRADPNHRVLLGKLGTFIVRRFMGIEVTDMNAGLKVFDTDLCSLSNVRSRGGLVSMELVARAVKVGRVAEMSILHHPRRSGESTGGSPRVLVGLVIDFVRLSREKSGEIC